TTGGLGRGVFGMGRLPWGGVAIRRRIVMPERHRRDGRPPPSVACCPLSPRIPPPLVGEQVDRRALASSFGGLSRKKVRHRLQGPFTETDRAAQPPRFREDGPRCRTRSSF